MGYGRRDRCLLIELLGSDEHEHRKNNRHDAHDGDVPIFFEKVHSIISIVRPRIPPPRMSLGLALMSLV